MGDYYLKLRNNIILDSDLQLAEREIKALFGKYSPIISSSVENLTFLSKRNIESNTRKGEVIGYYASSPVVPIHRIAILLSFIQEIWCGQPEDGLRDNTFAKVGHSLCVIPLMAMSELLFYTKAPDRAAANSIVTALAFPDNNSPKDIVQAINRAKTSAPHIHAFHTYKTKFFPRFVHSLIVSNSDVRKERINVCDGFVGSGTTLIESSLMGHDSVGIDIDALSCFISAVKCSALNMKVADISNEASGQGLFAPNTQNRYVFPDVIVKKFERWGALEEMKRYQSEISRVLDEIDSESSPYKELHRIALSDALTRKFNIRMMGTGSGRFALEIGKTSLGSIIKSDLGNEIKGVQTIQTIKDIFGIQTPEPTIIHGSATNRDIADKTHDIIITSPPYIPASSGREDYLVGKLISLKAMGLYNDNAVKFCQDNSVGSMSSISEDTDGLPQSVIDLYNWLVNDELRSIKAKPIISYYKSIKSALKEDMRTLKDDGRIIYIIGKETIFYNSTTKDILYKVDCDKIFVEIAESLGLRVIETINIELDKKDNIARPRGSDKYYECAIIMKKASAYEANHQNSKES